MKLIIIDGTTSTGKSTLARKLASDLKLRAFLRDDYKEERFDTLGHMPSFKELNRIEDESFTQMYAQIAGAVQSSESLIIESNLKKRQKNKIKHLITSDTQVLEIFCFASGFRVLRRYIDRNQSGERHKSHRDYLWYPIVAIEALGISKLYYQPLKLSPYLLKVDTNDFSQINYDLIKQFVINSP